MNAKIRSLLFAFILHPSSFPKGAVAQLGERSVRNAEVTGSIPVGSTLLQNSTTSSIRATATTSEEETNTRLRLRLTPVSREATT